MFQFFFNLSLVYTISCHQEVFEAEKLSNLHKRLSLLTEMIWNTTYYATSLTYLHGSGWEKIGHFCHFRQQNCHSWHQVTCWKGHQKEQEVPFWTLMPARLDSSMSKVKLVISCYCVSSPASAACGTEGRVAPQQRAELSSSSVIKQVTEKTGD